MRLLATEVTRDELAPHLGALQGRLRAIFFQSKRDIPTSPRQREALLRDGLAGLHEVAGDIAGTGSWRYYDAREQERALTRVHFGGGLAARGIFAFDAWIQASGARDGRDIQIGSVGGGNHFVELQAVEEIFDGPSAHAFGLPRGAVTVRAHSGSVGLGHMVGGPARWARRATCSQARATRRRSAARATAPVAASPVGALRTSTTPGTRAMEALRVVTPIDPSSTQVRCRRDILAKYHQRMKEEAPFAYKPITPVAQTVEEAGVARRVARLWPIMTVKG